MPTDRPNHPGFAPKKPGSKRPRALAKPPQAPADQPLPPTFLQQFLKSVVMLIGIVAAGYIFNYILGYIFSALTRLNQLNHDESTGELPSDSTNALTIFDSNALTVTPTNPTCAAGILALISSGFLPTQLAGAALLPSCIKFPGVKAAQSNATFLTLMKDGTSGRSVQQTPDGRFVVVGFHGVGMLFTEFDPKGIITWSKTLGGGPNNFGLGIRRTLGGRFFATGRVDSVGAGNCDLFLIEFDLNGTLSWAKTLGGGSCDQGASIEEAQNGDLVVVGLTESFGSGGRDILLMRVNSTGGVLSVNALGGTSNDIGSSIKKTPDNGFILMGSTTGFGAVGEQVLLIKLFSNNTVNWTKTVQVGNDTTVCHAIQVTQDGGFIGIGYVVAGGANARPFLIKLAPDGTPQWAIKLDGIGSSEGYSVQEVEDGYVLTGYSTSSGINNALVAKISSSTRQLVWANIIGGAAVSNAYSIEKTLDSGFFITGDSDSKPMVAKLDANGKIPNCNAMRAIYPTVTDITGLVNVTSVSPTVTTPSPTVLDWAVTAVSQDTNQTIICPKSPTVSGSVERSRSNSGSVERSRSNTPSLLSESPSDKSLLSLSPSEGNSSSISPSKGSSSSKSVSLSKEQQTPTPQRTRTPPLIRSTAILIQKSNLDMTGITQIQISPSGSLVLARTGAGFQIVTVNKDDAMTFAGQFAATGTAQTSTFSKDERHLYVAENNEFRVIDIQDPNNPKSIGTVSAGTTVQSLAISGGGDHLLVGTTTGIKVLSAQTPANPSTMTAVTSYTTSNPVTTIQTDPNSNVVYVGSGDDVRLLEFKDGTFTNLDQKTFSSPVKTISPIDPANPTQLTVKLNNGNTVFVNIADPRSTVVTSVIPGSPTTLTAGSSTMSLVYDENQKPGIQIFESPWGTPAAGYSPVIGGPVKSLSCSVNRGYCVFSDAQGLHSVVIKKPGRLDVPLPRLLTVVKLGFPIRDVLLSEAGNWIAVGGDRLTFISRENLQHPTILGTLNTADIVGSVQQMVLFSDNTKLLLVDGGGVVCVDCFNPEAPRSLGRWNTAQTIYGLTLSGSYAYVCQGEAGISVLDVSNPLAIVRAATLSTQGSAQSIQFNRARSWAFVADGSGIDIWSMQTPLTHQRISRFNSTGLISAVALSPVDEKTLYFANGPLLGRIDVTDPSKPTLSGRLDTARPIREIVSSTQGNVVYVAGGTDGLLVVDAKAMQIKAQLPTSFANTIALTNDEGLGYVAGMDVEVVTLENELSIIPLTTRTNYPVGISVSETLLFYDREGNRIKIDRINSIQYIDNGQKRELPLWISADLAQGKLFITAPKELTDKPIQLAISLDVNGVRQDTLYQASVISSLEINADKGVVAITTPAPTVSLYANLANKAQFIPKPAGTLSVSTQGDILEMFGRVSDVNNYLGSVRINPNPISLPPSAVALSPAQIEVTDTINKLPRNATVQLRSFRFNQPPVVSNPLNQANKKALDSFTITVPANTFTDPDDPTLTLSVQLIDGTALPSWLTFDSKTGVFSGTAPVSMLGQTLQIKLTASDGYLSTNTSWTLRIDNNNGPFVAKPIPPVTRTTGSEFSYTIPPDIFRDLDNDTLTLSAVQQGYDVLPGFLSFDPNTRTFLARPTSGDSSFRGTTYIIEVTATDKFGAKAKTTFDFNVNFSNWDRFLKAFEIFGITAAVLAPFTLAWRNRTFIRNTFAGKSYWRDTVPAGFLTREGYKPTHPGTGKKIAKKDIAKIRVTVIDDQKIGHDCVKRIFSNRCHASFFSKAVMNDNDAPLPAWMEYNSDTGTLRFNPEHAPPVTESKTYLVEVLKENGYVLEAWLINPHHASTYQPPVVVNLRDVKPDGNGDVDLTEFNASTTTVAGTRRVSADSAGIDGPPVTDADNTLRALTSGVDPSDKLSDGSPSKFRKTTCSSSDDDERPPTSAEESVKLEPAQRSPAANANGSFSLQREELRRFLPPVELTGSTRIPRPESYSGFGGPSL